MLHDNSAKKRKITEITQHILEDGDQGAILVSLLFLLPLLPFPSLPFRFPSLSLFFSMIFL
jgi:hypothetical protein